MIVNRLTNALRRQDWAMIAIEFSLVVAGVLLAFQINEWAGDRSRAREIQSSAERLLEEAELNVAYNRQAVDYEAQVLRGLGLATKQVTGSERPDADELKVITASLVRARSMVALAPPSSVYDDIVASGELNGLGDAGLRATIGRYHATRSFEERMRQQLQSPLADFERIPAFRYETDPEGKERVRLVVDIPALVEDRKAQQVIALTAENHRILLMLRTRALHDSEKMCMALAIVVGRVCNRNLPPPRFD